MKEAQTGDLIGRNVVIRSIAGIEYAGVVRSISNGTGGDELFELGRRSDPSYQRFVFVRERDQQVQLQHEADWETEGEVT